MAIAGKVAPIPRGAFNANTTYNKIDIVTHNGDTYMSLQGNNIGHTPTKSSNSWWICIFESPSVFTGASSSDAGAKGLVPAPASGDQNKVLKGNGSWAGNVGHEIQNASGTAMTQREKLRFDGCTVTDDSTNGVTKVTPNTAVADTFAGTCNTAAGTAAKVVTVTGTFTLRTGTIISVKFDATNTADSPTLNVNNTGAKGIWFNTGVITTSNKNRAGYERRYENYMYNGTYWVWIGHGIDDNTTYSTLTTAQIDAGTETTAKVATAKVIHDAITNRVKDSLSNTSTTDALSAAKGKALQDGKTDNSVIAPVESGTTASRAYAKGAHFIKSGAFCTAKTAIAQGETFTLNTNYTAGNIGDRVEALEGRYKISSASTDITTNTAGSAVLTTSGRRFIFGIHLNSLGGRAFSYRLGQSGDVTYLHLMDEAGTAKPNETVNVSYLFIDF